MPTGYTADVATGKIVDLEPFVLQLARGMGALIMMRDDAHDATIPEKFEPGTYHATRLAEARAERARLYAMTSKEAQEEADKEYNEQCAARDAYLAGKAAERDRYLAMIAKVEAWEGAPEGIKEFGLEQLRTGLDFDCREPFEYYRTIERQAGTDWKLAALAKVSKDIEYNSIEDAKERARTDGRNAWLAQLRTSLATQEGKL